MVDQQALVIAYRQLYRQGLRAVNYSTPARHVLLRLLRSSFRSGSRDDFNPQKIAETLLFLQQASECTGLEHKIVKNILMVRYWEQPQIKNDLKFCKGQHIKEIHLRKSAAAHFNFTLMLLNESLGTCLR